MPQGAFVTFEGGEGSGKTSAIFRLKEKLSALGSSVIITREPGGVTIADQIRQVILDINNKSMTDVTEVLLYAAARNQHLSELVIPALKGGKLVLCDRFVDSSVVYQGYARGQNADSVWKVNEYAIQGVMPTKTLWFDVDPEVGLERVFSNRGREVNRLDLEAMEFHRKVHEGYRLQYERYPERIVRIDANRSMEEVDQAVLKELKEFL